MRATVRLRPVGSGDVEAVAAFLAHPDLAESRGLPDDSPMERSVAALVKSVESLVDPELGAAWVVETDGIVGLALAGWWWDAHSPWAHVVVDPVHQRQGHGTAAFRAMMDRLFLQTPALLVEYGVPSWDAAGLAFAESLGGEQTGVRRRVGIHHGTYHDRIEFALLRPRWEELRAARG